MRLILSMLKYAFVLISPDCFLHLFCWSMFMCFKIAENMILLSVLYLIFWCHFFLLPGSEHGVGREFFICVDAAFVTPVFPRLVFLYSVTLFLPTSSNTAYSLSGIGRFDKILPYRHDDEQDQCLSSASDQISDVKYIWNNSYYIWTAGEDESVVWSLQYICPF